MKCPKCNGEMEKGIFDEGIWVEGEWSGLAKMLVGTPGRKSFRGIAWRCSNCKSIELTTD